MSQRNMLITDFFSKSRPTSVSNAALFEKPIKVIKVDESSLIKHQLIDSQLDQCTPDVSQKASSIIGRKTLEQTSDPNKDNQIFINSPTKSSIPSRIKFVRHHSAPLHHRSPVKNRERPIENAELEDMRTRIRAFHQDLYKYKSSYSRSPVKYLSSPLKSPLLQTPVKSYPSIPAFERFSPLATNVELPLPDKYQLLLEQYKNLDFIVCHIHNNGGISTFEKVQQVVQQKTKRNFTLETLGRIKTVCPTMYNFQQEKIQLPTLSPMKLKHELTIAPNISSHTQISPAIIIERINTFRHALFNLLKQHHRTFLSNKLQLKDDEIPNDGDLVRWHPDFDLSNIPDIDVSPLPESPDNDFKTLLASPIEIRNYAEKTKSERVKRALFSTFTNDDETSSIVLPSPKKETLSVDGISSSLIEKIRSKEINRLLTNPIDHEKQMLSRLEQTIAIVQQFFIAERVTVLEIDLVAKQIRDCHSGPLSYNQSTETLHFLHTYPANNGWLSIITVRDKTFIKINRHKSINAITEFIQRDLNK